jgi:triphosphoribosyl-dephospho-CoA synthase
MIVASADDRRLAAAAVAALHDELKAYPKPGLVSPVDSGAHTDMDFALMSRSADALLPAFARLAAAGREGRTFEQALRPLGVEAEREMLAATGGINTHRGAIFSMGLFVAAVARARQESACPTPKDVRAAIFANWGGALAGHEARGRSALSHGCGVLRRTGRAGARLEAALGFPSIFVAAIPALRMARDAGLDDNAVNIHTLFALMAAVDDTTVLFRGGLEGGSFVRDAAVAFLADGGCLRAGWFERAERLHRAFIQRNVSAGGCADLLACTLFVLRCCGEI